MDKKKPLLLTLLAIPGLAALAYLSGLLAQLLANYALWQELGGMNSPEPIQAPSLDPGVCFPALLSIHGLKSVLLILGILAAIVLYIRFHDRFGSGSEDPRGFDTSKSGIYGTASWMTESEMREILEINPIDKAEGTILGEYRGKAVCMPKDTRLNRHIAIFGASGTMKSRAIIRNALFQDIKRGESVIITDSKGELYADTSELFRKNGYDVKVFNLVNPEHGDSWNCMADLNGDTLMAQILTNVIIGNTSSGKGDHFWDGGEGNLLKALILYVDQDPTRDPEEKHLSAAYRLLTQNTEQQLTAIFDRLPLSHPARPPYSLFAQASETVKSGIIIGLGTRLQVLQNEAVQRITSQSDIDLTAPAKHKCAYYIVLSDQDSSMAFLSSLFFSFLFIKLTRYADSRPSGACDVPVNLILDEFNNIGRIGGAADGSDFARTLSVIRSRDIRVMLAIQSLGQLQNRYANNLWAEIIGNCDIQLMLGCTDGVTAEYFSARSGDMSVTIKSTMTVRQTMAVAQMIPQYRQTEGQGRRRLLTPDEVLRLPNTDLLCVIRGCNMLRLKKLDYTGHRMSKELQHCSILDYAKCTDHICSWDANSGKFTVAYNTGADGKNVMTISMTAAGLADINSSNAVYTGVDMVNSGYSDCTMRITYQAKLNSDNTVSYGDTGNSNAVALQWKRSNTSYYDTLVDDCHLYVYGIDAVKRFSDGQGDFSKVAFVIHNDTDNCFVTAAFNATEKVWYAVGHVAEATSATRFVPDASGKLIIKGLEDDTYSITEVTTSNGYSLLKNSVKLVIADTEAAAACGIYSTDALGLIQNDPRYAGVNPGLYKNMPQKHLEHKPLTAAATVDGNPVNMKPDGESGNAFVPFVCVNTKGFDLPQTGGHGSYWFPIIGLSGLALAVFGIVLLSRKKTAKDN